MLAVEDALQIVLRNCRPLVQVQTAISSAALGRILAEDVASDLDMPPFDKALMDGYAVRASDLTGASVCLPVAAEVMAGQAPPSLPPGRAIRIMTGAPIPPGADAVVRVEQTSLGADGSVQIAPPYPQAGQFILQRGREMQRGDIALQAGAVLHPQELGLLASVGRATAKLIPAPSLSILATGDELVEADQTPGPSQLRNSNGPMLMAQATRAGAVPRCLGIAPDRPDVLRSRVAEGLESHILALSGGVSMGKLDLVPGVLQELGVQPHFQQIAMKPGKPLFFGTRGETLVFGLPGNPVSSFCCFELFVRPAIRLLGGHSQSGPNWQQAQLSEEFRYRTDRPTYHPAWLENTDGVNTVRPVQWFGSPDLRALAKANALMLLPPGDHVHQAGKLMPVLALE
ncbi:MAG TPA: gephyrin-like molybdotransferase Glp [Gemmataceae bacterium]|jgi:molybdopterin molybdotransferase|nr:gephyrin-like molybdotransferase Glp [Gemmataceae bacterium]